MADTMIFDNMDLNDANKVNSDSFPQVSPSLKSPIILVVTRNGHLTEPVMDYAVNVADRLRCKLLAAYVNTLPFLWDDGKRSRLFAAAILESATIFRSRAAARGVAFDYVQEAGRVSKVISRLCHIVKGVQFVVIDKGIKIEEATSRAPVPVFNILCSEAKVSRTEPHRLMNLVKMDACKSAISGREYCTKAIIYAVLTGVLYAMLYTWAETIMNYWTMGGFYAVLPAGTVIVFFYTQGSLINNFLSAIDSWRTRKVRLKRPKKARYYRKVNEKKQYKGAGSNQVVRD